MAQTYIYLTLILDLDCICIQSCYVMLGSSIASTVSFKHMAHA